MLSHTSLLYGEHLSGDQCLPADLMQEEGSLAGQQSHVLFARLAYSQACSTAALSTFALCCSVALVLVKTF